MVKVDHAEAEPTRAAEIASFMVVMSLVWKVMERSRSYARRRYGTFYLHIIVVT